LIAKHFIIDDICCYVGSQNFYICDLAEWGVVIDDREKTAALKSQYWDPMWKVSYTTVDCEVDSVMDGLSIDRSAPSKMEMTKLQLQQARERMRATQNVPANSDFHAKAGKDSGDDDDDDEASEGEE
jgi:phosphatidylserine/phosphatidylglycerophosphate/cardiolipin synthase-like enzyme